MTIAEQLWLVTLKKHVTVRLSKLPLHRTLHLLRKLWNAENLKVKSSKQMQTCCTYVNVFSFFDLFPKLVILVDPTEHHLTLLWLLVYENIPQKQCGNWLQRVVVLSKPIFVCHFFYCTDKWFSQLIYATPQLWQTTVFITNTHIGYNLYCLSTTTLQCLDQLGWPLVTSYAWWYINLNSQISEPQFCPRSTPYACFAW